MIKELETERLKLVCYKLEHAKDAFNIYSDSETLKYAGIEIHNSIFDTENFISEILNSDNPYIYWAIMFKGSNKMIGDISIHLNSKHKFGSIGVIINKDYWHNGISFEALSEIINYSFNDLNINRLEAQMYVDHLASKKLFEKLGFKFEGILRQNFLIEDKFCDSLLYSLLKNEHKILDK